MEFGQAFSFQFKDPDWFKKIAITALITLIPIIGWLYVLGYGLEITRRVIRHEAVILPDVDFGGFLGKGFQLFIVQLVYSIPAFILSLPTSILSPMIESGSADETMTTAYWAIIACCSILQIVFSLLLAFLLPAAMGRLADTGSIGAALKVGDIFGLVRKAPVAFLLVLVGSFLAGLISGIGLIACIIGVFLTAVYAATITSHLTGQAYLEATGGQPV